MKFSRLILANLFRKKARLILTIGSFAVALFLFALLGVVNDAFSRGADVVSAWRASRRSRLEARGPPPTPPSTHSIDWRQNMKTFIIGITGGVGRQVARKLRARRRRRRTHPSTRTKCRTRRVRRRRQDR